MLTAQRAEDVARLFPLNGRTTGTPPTSVVVIVPVPGHEAAREAMLARDGAKDMRGDLDMGDHNIVGVDNEIVIGGQPLNTDDVDLLNQMSAFKLRELNKNQWWRRAMHRDSEMPTLL